MRAVLWTDYLCPWCYLARDRSALMAELGVEVSTRPFELHPEIPSGGRRIRPDGRLAPVFDRIEAECVEIGMPFRRPERFPSSRRALETAEAVRVLVPDAFAAVDEAFFRLHWVDGAALDEPDTLDGALVEVGVDPGDIAAALAAGIGSAAVDQSMEEARGHGIAATPTWLIDGGFVLPGAHPRETIARWIERIVARSSGRGVGNDAPAPR